MVEMDENEWKLMKLDGSKYFFWIWTMVVNFLKCCLYFEMWYTSSTLNKLFTFQNVVIILKCGQDSEVCSSLNGCKYIAIFLDVALHWTVVYI